MKVSCRLAGRLSGPLLAVPLMGLMLAGCDLLRGTPADRYANACPSVALLADAGDLKRFRGTGRDLTDLALDARITAVPATCTPGSKGAVKATLKLQANVVRGPAASDRTADVTIFLTVLEGERILDQADYRLTSSFPPFVDRITMTTEDIELVFPNTRDHPASGNRILVGFRLTPAELALNRSRGR